MVTHSRPLDYEPDTPLQQFLRELMLEHRLNQSQLARRLGIAPTNVSNYLSNEPRKRIVPSALTLDTLAERFGVDPAHLRRLANRPIEYLPAPPRGTRQVEDSVPALIDGIIVRLEALKRLLASGSA